MEGRRGRGEALGSVVEEDMSNTAPPDPGARRPLTGAAIALVVAVLLAAMSGSALAADPGVGRTMTLPTPVPSATPPPTSAPTPTSPTAPAGVTTLPATVTFYGRGYGHGVGLSQHGARGRALAGQAAADILVHYYQGTSLGSIDPATPIRVLVLSGYAATTAAPLVVVGRGGAWTIEGETGTFPVDARVSIAPSGGGGWNLVVTAADGRQLLATTRGASFRIAPADPGLATARLEIPTKPSAYDEFRGALRVIPSTTTISVVNELALDTYLRGVVPVEMPSSWPAQALAAQAIASRSYAAYRLRPGVSTFDIYDDTRSQVYRGYLGEQAAGDAAIAATVGAVLRAGSSVVNALFHSTGGGATENNENVFVSSTGSKVAAPISYLRGSPDRAPDGSAYDAGSPYATWSTMTYSLATLSSWFGSDSRTNVGSLTALDLRDRGVSGRLISVTLYGSAGSRKVSGDVFRSVFNASKPTADRQLRSTLFALAPIP
jgi:SpoIID/LytB domain protein